MSQKSLPPQFKNNLYFVQYMNLLVDLHAAMSAGDEDKADQVRETMDEPGLQLTEPEIQWLKGLSADLYMLQNEESFRPLDRSPLQLVTEIHAAAERADGETLLPLLRRARFLTREHLAWFRARAYEFLGYPGLSLRFLSLASDLAPQNAEYRCLIIGKCIQAGGYDEARQFALALLQQKQPAALQIFASAALYCCTRTLSREEAEPLLRQILEILNSLVRSQPGQNLARREAVMAWTTLATCYDELGQIPDALAADDSVVALNPKNQTVFETRGRHRLSVDPDGAGHDFETAIALGSRSSLPYLFVIRAALRQNDYQKAKRLSKKLISLTNDLRVKAQAFEFLALAYFGQGDRPERVKDIYERLLESTPWNPRRQENYKVVQTGEGTLNLPTLTAEEGDILASDVPSPSLAFVTMFNQASTRRLTNKVVKEDLASAA